MNDFSLVEKIEILMKLISSSSLFLVCSILGICILLFFIVCIILNKKVNKWIFILISIFVGIIMLINYGAIFYKIIDAIIDSIFTALYFPNLQIYVTVLVISNICFVLSVFSKNQTKIKKIVNIINAIVLDFLLILIIDIVSRNNINIYEEINLYTNSYLLVLLELSMGIFVSWILLKLVISAHYKLKKYDKVDYPDMPEILFE